MKLLLLYNQSTLDPFSPSLFYFAESSFSDEVLIQPGMAIHNIYNEIPENRRHKKFVTGLTATLFHPKNAMHSFGGKLFC